MAAQQQQQQQQGAKDKLQQSEQPLQNGLAKKGKQQEAQGVCR